MLHYIIKASLFFFVSYAQFIPLELNNLCYPITCYEWDEGITEDGNIYNYNVNDYGIDGLATSFTIGLWVQPAYYYMDQLVLSINYWSLALINYDTIFCLIYGSGCYSTSYYSWIYIYYENIATTGVQQICFLESYSTNPYCLGIPYNNYYIFNFIQITYDDYYNYGILNWIGQASSITIKLNNFVIGQQYSYLDYFTLLSSIEPQTVLDLSISEKTQTNVLQDSSPYQHLVQLGSTLDSDIYDPQYYNLDQSIQFDTNQYIYVDNFNVKQTCTIEFQFTSNGLPSEYSFLTLYSVKQQIAIFQIWIIPQYQEIILDFPYYGYSIICSIDVDSALNTLLTFISSPDVIQIYLIQSQTIVCSSSFYGSQDPFGFTNIDTLYIGSSTNSNNIKFNLYHLRISNGFYSPSVYLTNNNCLFSIDKCIVCLNNYYLFQGYCYSLCPSNTISNSKRMECIPVCHPTCSQCSSIDPTQCTVCSGIRINAPKCNCPPGYFDDGITPDCITYIPDRSIDSGFFEFQCFSYSVYNYQILFSKQYLYPPKVAISLMGHIDYYSSLQFQVYVSQTYSQYFILQVICQSYQGYHNIQWMAGSSGNFKNVVQNQYSPGYSFYTFLTSINYVNQIIGNFLGWAFSGYYYYFYFESFQSVDYEYFYASGLLNSLMYQILEYTNFIQYQYNFVLPSNHQQQYFSVGGSSVVIGTSLIPLSIPQITFLNYMVNPNDYKPQFYITEQRRPGQIEYNLKIQGYQYFPYFFSNILIAGVQCSDQFNACDYYEAMKSCNKILENCSCTANQYYDSTLNNCVNCNKNCLQCDLNQNNCILCPLNHGLTLITDISTGFDYCGCTQNQYLDSYQVCQNCDINCLYCITTSTYCTSCNINYVLDISNTCVCDVGYFDTGSNSCDFCSSSCLECVGQADNCTSCPYTGQLIPTCECPLGQKMIGGICVQYCPIFCESCLDQISCDVCFANSVYDSTNNICQCINGYYSDGIQCQQCQSPCQYCTSLTVCTTCLSLTEYLNVSTCTICVSPCITCNSLTSCNSCIDGYYIDSTYTCNLCTSPCLNCTSSTICQSCIDNTYYLDTSNLCQVCISPCLTCNTDIYCLSCISDSYYIDSLNQCANCISPCLTCQSELICSTCSIGYYLDTNSVCQACISPCNACTSDIICTGCLSGYTLDSSSACIGCTPPCLTCSTTLTTCLSCVDILMSIDTSNACACPTGYYFDSLNNICSICHPTCTTCVSGENCCYITDFKELIGTACQCISGYYLSGTTCLSCISPCINCTSASICTQCSNGYYLDTSSTCQTCIAPCLNCEISANQCTSCVGTQMILSNNICSCLSSQYYDTTLLDCFNCHPTCTTCSDSTDCCFASQFLQLDANQCICIPGYYFDSNQICQGKCISKQKVCDSNCLTCESTATNCLSCDLTKTYTLDGTQCKCQNSQQFIDPNGNCTDCSTNCVTCETSADNCTSCDLSKKLTLSFNKCGCKLNEYANINGICTPCYELCESCTDGLPTGCLSCIKSRKLNSDNRLCQCIDGTFENDNHQCEKCQGKCGTCIDSQSCLSCATNRSLIDNNCVCNDGYYENDEQTCKLCEPPCKTCISALNCLSCIANTMEPVNQKCQCIKGYYETDDHQCDKCSSQIGKLNDICNYINCGDGELTKGEECDDGNNYSRDGCSNCKIDPLYICINRWLAKSICYKCTSNCKTCSLKDDNKSSCDLCDDGYYLESGQCDQCDQSCFTCESRNKCQSCLIIDSKPDNDGKCPRCTNIKGFYIVNRKCITICGDSILVDNEQCDDGNTADGDGCNSKCEVEKYYTCKDSICTKIPQPIVEVAYPNSTTSNALILNFPSDQGDPCSRIKVTIDQMEQTEYNATIVFSPYDDDTSNCNVDFTFNKTIDVFNTIHLFVPVKPKTSFRLLEEETREVVLTPRKHIVYSQSQVDQAATAGNAQSSLGEMLYFIAPTAILLGGFSFFWTIMDILSWINNLYYMNIYFPENVRIFFEKSAWGDFQLFPAFFVLNQPDDPYYIESPKKFMEKGVDPIFLNNTWTCFAIMAITIVLYVISSFFVLIFEGIWPKQFEKTHSVSVFDMSKPGFDDQIIKQKKLKEKKKRFPYVIEKLYAPLLNFKLNFKSNLIKSLNLAFLDLVLAITLQLTSVPGTLMEYKIVLVNQILSYVSVGICLITLIVSYYVTTKHSMLLEHKYFENHYGTLYENINTKSQVAMLYSFVNLNRKAFFIVIVVYFYYQPLLQTLFCTFISFLNIALIIYENPFQTKMDLLQNGGPDFCIFLLMLLSTGFALDDIIGILNADNRFLIGWLMIGVIGLSIGIQIVFLLREFFRDLRDKFLYVRDKVIQLLNSK